MDLHQQRWFSHPHLDNGLWAEEQGLVYIWASIWTPGAVPDVALWTYDPSSDRWTSVDVTGLPNMLMEILRLDGRGTASSRRDEQSARNPGRLPLQALAVREAAGSAAPDLTDGKDRL